MQFLGVQVEDFFNTEVVLGKVKDTKKFTPTFDINERRKKWLELLEENKGATRSELKEKGKGLHTWIFRYDREWYEKVTPRVKTRKPKADLIDWEKKDEECLLLAKEAVQYILNTDGKPIRVTPNSITSTVGERSWFRKNKNLTKTLKFLEEAKEDIDDFRIRKIKWAIEEMEHKGENITAYKIQLYAGFGGSNPEVRGLIESILSEKRVLNYHHKSMIISTLLFVIYHILQYNIANVR